MENVAGGGVTEGNLGVIVEKVIKTINPDFEKDKTTGNGSGNKIMDILKDESGKKEPEVITIEQGGCCDPVNRRIYF